MNEFNKKPTTTEQIEFIKSKRKENSDWLDVVDGLHDVSTKQIEDVRAELHMYDCIWENLIAVRFFEEAHQRDSKTIFPEFPPKQPEAIQR